MTFLKAGALLAVHHSAKAQGLDRNLRLSLTAAKLDLMKQLVERSLPAIAGFGSLISPRVALSPSLVVVGLGGGADVATTTTLRE